MRHRHGMKAAVPIPERPLAARHRERERAFVPPALVDVEADAPLSEQPLADEPRTLRLVSPPECAVEPRV